MSTDYVTLIEEQSNAWVAAMDADPHIGRIIRGDARVDEYVAFLGATYQYVRWSGPLLASTAEGLRHRSRYPRLLEAVDVKTDEESSHHHWVLEDLAACGTDTARVERAPVPNAIQAYVQWSLAMAHKGSPAYLGAAYTLEFISMKRASLAAINLCARRRIPNIENAVTFLAAHGEADLDHVAALGSLLRQIGNERDREDVALSAAVMRSLFPQFFAAGEAS
jgi:pyrroloquinoline quinone (PQQ) biosynthesis protein C